MASITLADVGVHGVGTQGEADNEDRCFWELGCKGQHCLVDVSRVSGLMEGAG